MSFGAKNCSLDLALSFGKHLFFFNVFFVLFESKADIGRKYKIVFCPWPNIKRSPKLKNFMSILKSRFCNRTSDQFSIRISQIFLVFPKKKFWREIFYTLRKKKYFYSLKEKFVMKKFFIHKRWKRNLEFLKRTCQEE